MLLLLLLSVSASLGFICIGHCICMCTYILTLQERKKHKGESARTGMITDLLLYAKVRSYRGRVTRQINTVNKQTASAHTGR